MIVLVIIGFSTVLIGSAFCFAAQVFYKKERMLPEECGRVTGTLKCYRSMTPRSKDDSSPIRDRLDVDYVSNSKSRYPVFVFELDGIVYEERTEYPSPKLDSMDRDKEFRLVYTDRNVTKPFPGDLNKVYRIIIDSEEDIERYVKTQSTMYRVFLSVGSTLLAVGVILCYLTFIL